MLPFGTKSIPEIKQGTDDTTKLFELATLLEYLLKKRKPGLKSKNGGHMGLCERIKKNKDAFANMNSVIKAVSVRNDITHASENGHTPRSIHQNYLHLMEGVICVAKKMPITIQRDVLNNSNLIMPEKSEKINNSPAKNQKIERRQVNLYRMPKTIYPGFSMKLSVVLGVIFVLTGLFFAMGDHILRFLDIQYQVKTVQARKVANQCQRNIRSWDIPDPLKKDKNELDDIFYNANNCFKKKTYLSLRNARHLYETYAKKFYDLKDNIKHYKTQQKDLPANQNHNPFDIKDQWTKNSSQNNDQTGRFEKKVEKSKVEKSNNISKQRIPKPNLITKCPKFRKPKRMKKAISVVSIDEAKKIFSPYLTPGLYVIGTVPANYYLTPQPASYNNLIRLKVFKDYQEFIRHGTNPLNDRQLFSQSTIMQTDTMKHFFQIFQNMSNIFAQKRLLKP